MTLLNLVPRNTYHKNGTQWIGKIINKIIGEKNYEFIRVEKRISYARYYYTKQSCLLKLTGQYPNIATFFSLLNKHDTSSGFPARRAYERHADFAVYNFNHEGWFQLYFTLAAAIVMIWNWWMMAYYYDVRGVDVDDDDLYRFKDARVTTCFDRTKYNYDVYYFSPHYYAVMRNAKALRDHPDDPRMNFRTQMALPWGDRYVKYYGYSRNMRLV